MLLYAETINMLDGLAYDEIDRYLDEQPKIVPLFKIDVAEAVTSCVAHREDEFAEPNQKVILELR